jgi:hypothetical protein
LLEEEVQERLSRRDFRPIALLGMPGSGRTTALEHLTALFGKAVLCLEEVPTPDAVLASPNELVIYSFEPVHEGAAKSIHLQSLLRHQVYHLASWGKDDLIEYLLARHKDRSRAWCRTSWTKRANRSAPTRAASW